MIESIAEIGRIYKEAENKPIYDMLIEHPKNVQRIVALCVNTQEKTVKICDEGDVTEEKLRLALYTKPPSSGAGAAPTAILTEPKKTLNGKILGWFERTLNKSCANKGTTECQKIKEARDILQKVVPDKKSKDETEVTKTLKNYTNTLVTVKIDGKWPAEVPWIQDAFRKYLEVKMFSGSYGGLNNAVSKGKGTCAICGKEDVEVYGFVLPWAGMKFATADKPGFFKDLNVESAWKVLPICKDCAWNIRIGWKVLEDYESEYTVDGLRYLVFPSKGATEAAIRKFIRNLREEGGPKVFSHLAATERTIATRLETNVDVIVYYVPSAQSQKMEIYLMEENIPPGRFMGIFKKNGEVLQAISETAKSVKPKVLKETLENALEKLKRGALPVIQAYLEILKEVYEQSNKSNAQQKKKKLKELAQIIHAILREQRWPGRRYAYFTRYVEKKTHNEQTGLDYAYIYPIFAYLYFVGGDKLSEDLLENIEKNFPSKTAEFAFWTGVLARHVIEMQRKSGMQPGAEPFRKRIRNVRMNVHQLQRLFTEAFEKAKTYSEILGEPWVTWTNILLEKCAKRATNADSATPDEIGFFFAIGYGLYWEIVNKNKKGGEEDGE